jgi:hypothetical protein
MEKVKGNYRTSYRDICERFQWYKDIMMKMRSMVVALQEMEIYATSRRCCRLVVQCRMGHYASDSPSGL